jgi:hypothetical protein
MEILVDFFKVLHIASAAKKINEERVDYSGKPSWYRWR